ncbi:hypothetical protein ACFYV7_39480 [Nocardia suismassiliense]|uniref:Secreted protein n=1 Tax=Nocardia suismassiliense TaxID=2077092 RepID=A0ABW6R612_9NOCA
MPKRNVLTLLMRSLGVLFAGVLGAGLLTPSAQAAPDKTDKINVSVQINDPQARFEFDGTVSSTDDSYTIDGSLHGGCILQKATASLHWTLPGGEEHSESVPCADTEISNEGVTKDVSSSPESTSGSPVLFIWICLQRDGGSEKCSPRNGGRISVLDKAQPINVSHVEFNGFSGAVSKTSAGIVIAGVLKSGVMKSMQFCKKYEGMTLRATFQPGGETRGDVLGCPGPEGDDFFKYSKLEEQIDADAVELEFCLERKGGKSSCSSPEKITL